MTGHPAGPPMAECELPQMFGNKLVQAPDLVLVTGAEGVLGGGLFYDLLRAEFNIRCLVRFEDESKIDRKPGVEFFYCDPLKGDIPETAFEGVKYVVNIASPLNTGSLPVDDPEALERLNNVLITRCKMKGISRYISLSAVNVAESTDRIDAWPGICWHLEYSAVNSGIPYTIFRAGLLVGDTNQSTISQIAASGGMRSIFGRKPEPLYVTPIKLLTEAVSRALKTEQAGNKTYGVVLEDPVARKELSRFLSAAKGNGRSSQWEMGTQIQLSSSRHTSQIHSVSELELRPTDFATAAQVV